jgi:predicted transcriptional regulator
MSEALFILTIVFVAYVVYVVVGEHKATSKSAVPKAKPEVPKVVAEQPTLEAVVKSAKPAIIKPAAIKKTTPAATTQDTVKKGLRDPKTGEIATTYNNYRFTKRWIKDALVTEGLLEKVYKNTELDAAIEAAIKEALVKLEAIDKYKP